MKLLLVEDDRKAARSLQQGLREEGFIVDGAQDGQAASKWRGQNAIW